MAARFNIVRGPGRDDFKTIFFNKHLRTTVGMEFQVEGEKDAILKWGVIIQVTSTYWFKAILDQVVWEDGSGDSWNFLGCATRPGELVPIRGHYSTKTNVGFVIFETAEEAERARLTRAIQDLEERLANRYGTAHMVSALNVGQILNMIGWTTAEEHEAALRAGLIS